MKKDDNDVLKKGDNDVIILNRKECDCMNKNVINTIDNVLIIMGVSIGLQEIESIIGIVLLCVQLLWILSKIIIKIYNNIKNNEYDQIPEDIKETIEELKDLKEGNPDGR